MTDRYGNVAVLKSDTVGRKAIDVRRGARHRATKGSHGIPVHVVGGDKQYVWSVTHHGLILINVAKIPLSAML